MDYQSPILMFCLCSAFFVSSEGLDGRFHTGRIVDGGLSTFDVKVPNIDNDGDGDIISLPTTQPFVYVYENANNGSWVLHETLVDINNTVYRFLAIGDIDEDGFLDLFITSENIYWLRNQGNYSFEMINLREEVLSHVEDFSSIKAFLGDVNGDGHLDVAVGGYAKIFYLEGNGAGSFKLHTTSLSESYVHTVFAYDMNADGTNELLVGTVGGLLLYTYDNSSSQFREQSTILNNTVTFPYQSSFTVGHLEDSNSVNIVLAIHSAILYVRSHDMYKTDRELEAQLVTNATAGGLAMSAVVADLDLDGDDDIVGIVSREAGTTVSWYENLGGGSFSEINIVANESSCFALSVAVGDIDGDGFQDIIFGCTDAEGISWYRNGEYYSYISGYVKTVYIGEFLAFIASCLT